jgi:hypothetical protein
MYALLSLITALVRLWAPQTPAECEMPPWDLDAQKHAPTTLITDYYASAVVGAKDVINAENALGWRDGHPAILTETSVLTVSWTFPFKSGAALWMFAAADGCPYAKITISHYASLTSSPITTTELWLTTSIKQYVGIGEDIDRVLPLHRYVVITTNWPIWVDAVFHPLYTNLEIRWLPFVMAQ